MYTFLKHSTKLTLHSKFPKHKCMYFDNLSINRKRENWKMYCYFLAYTTTCSKTIRLFELFRLRF